jgi:hypothetical protein
MKNLTIMKSFKNLGILSLLFSCILLLGITSCSDDDVTDDPQPQDNDEVEAETGIFIGFRVQTPSGNVLYIDVNSSIPEEITIDGAVELGQNQSIYAFGEHPFTFSRDASTLTKWNVDKTDLSLSVAGVMSFASTGLSRFYGEPVFMSETQAYFTNLPEGKIVEFNPEEMTLTQVHDVTPLSFPGIDDDTWYTEWDTKIVRNGKIIMPIGYFAGSNFSTPDGATVAVFDIASNTITYNTDSRSMAGTYRELIDESTGNIYQSPAFENPFAAHYTEQTDPLPTQILLKINPDGTYDPDYSLAIGDSLNATGINNVPLVFDNKAIVIYSAESDFQIPEDPADRWNSFNLENITKSTIDLTTGEVEPFTALDNYKLFNFHTTIDGVNYMWARNDNDDTEFSYLLKQNSIDDYTQVTELVGGQIRRIRKLW